MCTESHSSSPVLGICDANLLQLFATAVERTIPFVYEDMVVFIYNALSLLRQLLHPDQWRPLTANLFDDDEDLQPQAAPALSASHRAAIAVTFAQLATTVRRWLFEGSASLLSTPTRKDPSSVSCARTLAAVYLMLLEEGGTPHLDKPERLAITELVARIVVPKAGEHVARNNPKDYKRKGITTHCDPGDRLDGQSFWRLTEGVATGMLIAMWNSWPVRGEEKTNSNSLPASEPLPAPVNAGDDSIERLLPVPAAGEEGGEQKRKETAASRKRKAVPVAETKKKEEEDDNENTDSCSDGESSKVAFFVFFWFLPC